MSKNHGQAKTFIYENNEIAAKKVSSQLIFAAAQHLCKCDVT